MDSSSIGIIVALVLLVIASAYFSATETAFSSLNKIRLRNMADDGNRKAEATLRLAEDFDRLLSTLLVGNNIVNITAATLGTLFFTKLSPEYGATISTVVLTLVILTFGEISPKTIAKENAESWAMVSTPFLRVLSTVLRPLTILFSLLQKGIGKLFHASGDRGITEDELITMVSTAEDEGGLDQNESRLIRSAIEFGDMEVEEILTPRVDIVSISDQASAKELDELISSNRFSRIPVWRGSIDTIIGMIHEKDFHEAELEDNASWTHLISPVIYVTPTSPVADLLYEMQRRKMHMSVVVDEYGGTEGLVTLEDILEELVGEIWDEHDEVVERIRKVEDGSYLISCSASIDDVFQLFDLRMDDDMTTLSAWVIDSLGHIPKIGDQFTYENLQVTVTKLQRMRVLEIRVDVLPEAAEAEEQD